MPRKNHPLTRFRASIDRGRTRGHSRRRSTIRRRRETDYDCEAAGYAHHDEGFCRVGNWVMWALVSVVTLGVLIGGGLLISRRSKSSALPSGQTTTCSGAPVPNAAGHDSEFPGESSWKRPCEGEIPLFGASGPQLTDVKQSVSNCWLMASIAVVAMRDPEYIKQIVRPSKTKRFFAVDLWITGVRKTIFVDDRLPPGHLEQYAKHGFKVYWFAYIEKAFAKHHGSYKALYGGGGVEGMACLTGKPADAGEISGCPKGKCDNKQACTHGWTMLLSVEKLRAYSKNYCVTFGAGSGHIYVVVKVDNDNIVHLFDPNNHDYKKHPETLMLKVFKAGEKRGMCTIPYSTLANLKPSKFDICWRKKYTLVKTISNESHTLTMDTATTAQDIFIAGFMPSCRTEKGKKYPEVIYLIHASKNKDHQVAHWKGKEHVIVTPSLQPEFELINMRDNLSYELIVEQGKVKPLNTLIYVLSERADAVKLTVEKTA